MISLSNALHLSVLFCAWQMTPLPLLQAQGKRKFVPSALGCDLYCAVNYRKINISGLYSVACSGSKMQEVTSVFSRLICILFNEAGCSFIL